MNRRALLKYGALVILFALSPVAGNAHNSTEAACDFAIEIKPADFCVISGRVHDMDVTLTPRSGLCEGSATLSLTGLPSNLTHTILPSPQIRFGQRNNLATIRMDTAGIALKERVVIPLTVTATHEGLLRTATADMTVDLPVFDFALQPATARLRLFQEETASTQVEVRLLGAACQESPPPVHLALHRSTSPLSFNVTHQFSADFIVPSGETTVSLMAASTPEIGSLKTTLAGCCAVNEEVRTAEFTIEILPRRPTPSSIATEEEALNSLSPFEHLVDHEESVKVDSLENILTHLTLPETLEEEAKKSIEEHAQKGYQAATEEEVHSLKQAHAGMTFLQAEPMLTFEPSSLKETPFEALSLENVHITGSHRAGKWTAMVQRFKTDDGTLIELTEEDVVASGGMQNVMAKEGIDLYIHGIPAPLTVQQSPSGQALSRISWQTKTRAYNLRMEGNVKSNPQKKAFFLNLAQSLPQK